MRWYKKEKLDFDYRIKKKFALFPVRVNNEYRWLETCYILQERWYSWYESGWSNIAWTDEKTYEAWKKHTSLKEREEAWNREIQ